MQDHLNPIGSISTPYNAIEDCPNNIDPNDPLCELVIDEAYQDGVVGLQPGQKILILYWFEGVERNVTLGRSANSNGDERVGTFALRTPHRPNPIGAAILPIESIQDGTITVKGLDCLNGTKLLDIKPAIMAEL